MSESTATDLVVKRLRGIRSSAIDERTDHQVRRCLIDYLGCVAGGAAEAVGLRQALACFGVGESRVLGTDQCTSTVGAAFANGFYSHYLELDDGHRRAMQHLGAPVFSVLAALVDENTSWDVFAKAVVSGYEVAVALGEALQPRHKLDGFHATGTCGTVGAAAAASVLLGLNEQETRNALSAAATTAAGLLEVIGEGSTQKPYNIAHACAAAVMACAVASAGYNGPVDPLGGRRGFLKDFGCDPKRLAFGDDLHIHGIYTKPYSACRHCHSPIECAERISAEAGVRAQDVESIRVDTYDLAVFGHDQKRVRNIAEAKMSTPFGVASVLVGRGAFADAFVPAALEDRDLTSLMEKVIVCSDEAMTAACPDKRGARVTVLLVDGSSLSEEVMYPKGEPENAMDDDDMVRKAEGLFEAAGMNACDAHRLIEMAWDRNSAIQDIFAAC